MTNGRPGDMMSCSITLASLPLWVYLHLPIGFFVFCFGACVGSFINVVVFRLPAGISVISPPSRCPTCGARLSWRENLPILGWLVLRGRCRHCQARISPQYLLVELLMAVLFTVLYAAFFVAWSPASWPGQVAGAWWHAQGLLRAPFPAGAWPSFMALAFLFAGLVAMTMIDARTFTIQIQIPIAVTLTAFAAAVVQGLLPAPRAVAGQWPIPVVCAPGLGAAIGGMLGLVMGIMLLRSGRLRYSFADYADYLPMASQDQAWPGVGPMTAFELIFFVPVLVGCVTTAVLGPWFGVGALVVAMAAAIITDRGQPAGMAGAQPDAADQVLAPAYPYARREMLSELLFLTPCILGLVIGGIFAAQIAAGVPPVWAQALGGSVLGYIVGGGLVWAVRILGTLAFGREAMGLGDVHLMGAVGAVLGWQDAAWVFFLAPFSGLIWLVLSMTSRPLGLSSTRRELPYGPHLAVAALVVVCCRPGLHWFWMTVSGRPYPVPTLCAVARVTTMEPVVVAVVPMGTGQYRTPDVVWPTLPCDRPAINQRNRFQPARCAGANRPNH